jgi:hypothetical protein
VNGWALATHVAIWTLIVGSVAVFAWFLSEAIRLTTRGRRPPTDVDAPPVPDDEARRQ